MSLFKPFRGNRASLDAIEKHDGYAYFCMDDGTFHIDYADADGILHRKQINADEANKLAGYNIATALNNSEVEIPTSSAVFNAIDAAKSHSDDNLAAAKTYTDDAVAQKSQVKFVIWGADD